MIVYLKKIVKAFIHALGMYGLSFLKLQVIWGSFFAFFSINNVFGPLTGYYGGSFFAIAVYAIKRLLYIPFVGLTGFSILSLHIPAIVGALYWSIEHRFMRFFIRFFIPALCMMLFMIHPVGSQAWVYALYWFIPCVIYLISKKNIALDAIGSTFTTHAIGSVLWLYLTPTESAMWLGLLPIVVLERLCFASGMVAIVKGVEIARSLVTLYIKPKVYLKNKSHV